MFRFNDLVKVTGGEIIQLAEDLPVRNLLYDSRKSIISDSSVFFAISGTRRDGHEYIDCLYSKGVRQFVVEGRWNQQKRYPSANFLRVENSVCAMQAIAASHRQKFTYPVIGVTGSNGKTIVKEWASQILAKYFNIVRSPRSFNSQIGVPLSVWQMSDKHDLAIFEAGISKIGEMEQLEQVISPEIGLITNLGSAHDEGFSGRKDKLAEKLKLFKNSSVIICCSDHEDILQSVKEMGKKVFTWGRKESSDVLITEAKDTSRGVMISGVFRKEDFSLTLPYNDAASVENLLHVATLLFYLNIPAAAIEEGMDLLHPVGMRLEVKEAINGCCLIDDAYNNDLAGLINALNYLNRQTQWEKKSVVLSDIAQPGSDQQELYKTVADLVNNCRLHRFVGIGPVISFYADQFEAVEKSFFPDTAGFINALPEKQVKNEVILVKGARAYKLEGIIEKLVSRVHGTVLEINLDALAHNLNFYKSLLQPETKIMVMVKAFAYGSGSYEVANLLQAQGVDYLAVAYADEGVDLRQQGLSLPVMVMNPSASGFQKMQEYNLEPEIYGFRILNELLSYPLSNGKWKIHLKLDTGMHRLGFEEHEVEKLCKALLLHKEVLTVASIFTHLAGADEAIFEDFSRGQIEMFARIAGKIERTLGYQPVRHVLNSAGIVRFNDAQYNMVRLGIGLYGVESNGIMQEKLETVGTLKTIISQIRTVSAGNTVGYSRKGLVNEDREIATIAIGYADGYDRRFSNGKGKVMVNNKLCPVIGNVCMDMTMIDVTGADAIEGDEVIVFSKDLSIVQVAKEIGTIPYELLTNISERVKRVFFTE